jgi:excinuclease ABC subunit C
MTRDQIKSQIKMLPESPGVYKYFDKEGVIIYVGKAKNLKRRVNSYFTKNHEDFKTHVLVSKIHYLEYTVVDSEMDALLLENSLIKEFQPKYNINLKDDKSYPFIKITKERFPKVFPMRNPIKDGSEYFGPYASIRVMNTVLDLCQKLYPTRNCNLKMTPQGVESGKYQLCLEYHIGNCKAPCVGNQSEADYIESIRQIRHILKGNLSEVKNHLKDLMIESASRLAFEEAQKYKDRLDLLDKYQSRSTIVSPTVGDVEVYSISSTEKLAFVNFLRVHQGIIVISRNVEIRKKLEESDQEILLHVIGEMRSHYGDGCREIICLQPIEWPEVNVVVTQPKVGDKRKLLELSHKNAMLYRQEKLNQYEKLNPAIRVDRLMEQMQQDLRLRDQPRHIECFDNSNFQGAYPVSACVVFRDGKPAKNDYRHFNVKTVEGPNDFATMKEAITRRYSRLLEEGKPLPQLIVVDGGKGQLSAAVEALKDLKIYTKLAIVGIAKRLEEIYYPNDPLPLYIDKKSETLKVIQHMRDEAHRFGITHHRQRRDKGTLKTSLTDIPGIGPAKAKMLLKEFKSITRIKESSVDTLSPVVGKAAAEIIVEYYLKGSADAE